MAKLSDATQLDIVNKLALGISSTSTDKNYFEEDFTWSPTVLADEIWADSVPYASTQAEADDVVAGVGTGNPTSPVVEKLILYQMDEIPLSNEQGWAIYQTPGVPDPDTRIVDWLNPKLFGPGYFFEIFENDGTPISLTDSRYQVDSKNGVVRFEDGFTPADLGLLTPLKITLYRYNGRKGVITTPTDPGSSAIPHQEIVPFTAIGPTDGNSVIGQTTFSVSNKESFRLFLNQNLQVQGQEYNLVGTQNNQIEWLIDSHGISLNPSVDQLVALYSEESVSLPLAPKQQELVTENIGVTDGDVILANTLDVGVSNPESVRLFLNKQFQVQGPGRDYSLTGVGFTSIIWQAGTGTATPMFDTDELVATYLIDADSAVGPTGPTGPALAISLQQVSSNTTLVRQAYQYVGLDTSVGSYTITLPSSPQEGDRVIFRDETGNISTNNIFIDGNGSPVDGNITSPLQLATSAISMIYAFGVWRTY